MQGNIDRFATYVIQLFLRFAENGGSDVQDFDKVYKVLIKTSCTVFKLDIVVYKQVDASKLDVIKLLVKTKEEYRTLVENKT